MTSTFIEGGNVQANGIRQHYLRFGGKGAPLVVIPGITSPAVTWGFVAERLGLTCDTYVLDVRGRGLSQSGPGLDYGLDSLADDLIGFTEALGLGPVALLGHSMGARIAARALGRGAGNVDRVVLVDPPVSGPGRRPYPSQLPWYLDSIKAATFGMTADAMRAFCPTWTQEQLSLRAEWLHTCYEPAIRQAFDGFHTDDIHRDLARLGVPALLMLAGKGGVVTPEDEAEIRTLLPSIEVSRVNDAGHMIPWDDFEGFFAALGDFLGRPKHSRRTE